MTILSPSTTRISPSNALSLILPPAMTFMPTGTSSLPRGSIMFAKRGNKLWGVFGTDLSKYAGRVFEKEHLKVEEPRISPSAVYDFAFRVTAGIYYSASWTDIPSPHANSIDFSATLCRDSWVIMPKSLGAVRSDLTSSTSNPGLHLRTLAASWN